MLALFVVATAFAPLQPTLAPATARAATPVMSEMSDRRAAILKLGLGAVAFATTPLAANAAGSAVPIWKVNKKGLGAKSGPPKGSGADKCKVSKPCTTGAGLKWDPKALGVAKGATTPDGKNPRSFLKTKTYLDSPF